MQEPEYTAGAGTVRLYCIRSLLSKEANIESGVLFYDKSAGCYDIIFSDACYYI